MKKLYMKKIIFAFLFLFLGALFAVSLEQLLWWQSIIFNRQEIQNDWWIFISEKIKASEQNEVLSVLYTTNIKEARFVYNFWIAIFLIALILIVLLLIYQRKDWRKEHD